MKDSTTRFIGRLHLARLVGMLTLAVMPVHRGIGQALKRAAPEEVGMSTAALQQIAPRLQRRFVDSAQAPGFVVVIARHGKIAFLDSIGFADVEHRIPMGLNTVFRIYSMTKPVTTVAIMQLIERGKINLDDSASRFLPGFARIKVRASPPPLQDLLDPTQAVTIRTLLTHTAGLSYARPLMLRGKTIADFADSVSTLPLLFQPGSEFRYSSAADVLGRIVEIASGKSFDAYLRDQIFAPLRMQQTSFHAQPDMAGRIAVDYGRVSGGPIIAPPQLLEKQYLPESRLLMGGEGLLSTPLDYLRFAQMLLNGGELDGHRILKRETVAMMLANQIPPEFSKYIALVAPQWIPDGTYGFGFGGAIRLDTPTATYASKGTYRWEGAHATFFWVDPINDMVVTLWTQCGGTCSKERFEKQVEHDVYAAITRP